MIKDPSAQSAQVFCLERAKEYLGGDATRVVEMGIYFMQRLPSILDNLAHAVAQKDFKETGRLAHKLKGSIGNFGAMQTYAILQALEKCCESNSYEQLLSAYQIAQSGIAEFTEALSGFINSHGKR